MLDKYKIKLYTFVSRYIYSLVKLHGSKYVLNKYIASYCSYGTNHPQLKRSTRVNTRVQMQKTCVVLDHVYTCVKFNAHM